MLAISWLSLSHLPLSSSFMSRNRAYPLIDGVNTLCAVVASVIVSEGDVMLAQKHQTEAR